MLCTSSLEEMLLRLCISSMIGISKIWLKLRQTGCKYTEEVLTFPVVFSDSCLDHVFAKVIEPSLNDQVTPKVPVAWADNCLSNAHWSYLFVSAPTKLHVLTLKSSIHFSLQNNTTIAWTQNIWQEDWKSLSSLILHTYLSVCLSIPSKSITLDSYWNLLQKDKQTHLDVWKLKIERKPTMARTSTEDRGESCRRKTKVTEPPPRPRRKAILPPSTIVSFFDTCACTSVDIAILHSPIVV